MRLQITPRILWRCVAAPAAEATDRELFRATATIEKRPVSAIGRHAALGQVLRKHQTSSTDGRHGLKASAATCRPSLFRNGFPTP